MTRSWLPLVAAGAIVVLAVGLAGSAAQRPPSAGRDGSETALDAGRLRLAHPERLRQPIHGTAAPPDGSVDVTVSDHVILTDGRELADTLTCSVGRPMAASPGVARGPSTVDAAGDADAAGKADAAGHAEVAAGSAHQHGVDPVSAALLVIDGVVALAVVVLLLRRPPPQPSRPPS